MNIQTEFSKHADCYGNYNIIQRQVVEKLIDDLDDLEKPKRILDLGCGNGTLYRALTWNPEYFVGVDFAPRMLELHPKAAYIECIYGDFNNPLLFEQLQFLSFDRVFSASALQWAEDLKMVFSHLKLLQASVSLAIFSSGTFETLLRTAGLSPLLQSETEITALAKECFCDADVQTVHYQLTFDSVRDMFRYIKRSGVSAGRNVLTYRQTKTLMETYPIDYLEFEVVFIRT